MGVWIEINNKKVVGSIVAVTPCVGVWIEISKYILYFRSFLSLPVWECGLKSLDCLVCAYAKCHSLCGSVD